MAIYTHFRLFSKILITHEDISDIRKIRKFENV